MSSDLIKERPVPPMPGWWHRAGARNLALALMVSLAALPCGDVSAASREPDATTILRRADLVRNPFLGTALSIELSVDSQVSGQRLRSARYTMLTHRSDRTLMVLHEESGNTPGAVLITEDSYWLLLPRAQRPVHLAFQEVVKGDLSHAGFLRYNLRLRYQPRMDGQEVLRDHPCWRLELTPRNQDEPFGRVRYWVAKESFLPIQIEFYSRSDQLLKTARFSAYQETATGLRPAQIEIEDTGRPQERATLILARPQSAATSQLKFDLDDLLVLREVVGELDARSEGTEMSGRALVAAMVKRRTTEKRRAGKRAGNPGAPVRGADFHYGLQEIARPFSAGAHEADPRTPRG